MKQGLNKITCHLNLRQFFSQLLTLLCHDLPCIVSQIIEPVHRLSATIVPLQLQSRDFVPDKGGTIRISNQIFSSLQKSQNVGTISFLLLNQLFLFGNGSLNCWVIVGKVFVFNRFSVDFLQNQQNLQSHRNCYFLEFFEISFTVF